MRLAQGNVHADEGSTSCDSVDSRLQTPLPDVEGVPELTDDTPRPAPVRRTPRASHPTPVPRPRPGRSSGESPEAVDAPRRVVAGEHDPDHADPLAPREPTAAELAVMVDEAAVAERDTLAEETLDDPVRLYLREIGKVRLLTWEQEQSIGRRMEDGLRAEALLPTCPPTDLVTRAQLERLVADRHRARRELTEDRKSTRLNSSHTDISRMPSSA